MTIEAFFYATIISIALMKNYKQNGYKNSSIQNNFGEVLFTNMILYQFVFFDVENPDD